MRRFEHQSVLIFLLFDDLVGGWHITHGRLVLPTQRVDLWWVLLDSIASGRLRLVKQQHLPSAYLPQYSVLVNVDPTRLTQVVSNLLNNAARYTPDGGNITLHASCDGDDVLITVRDNGIGIPETTL